MASLMFASVAQASRGVVGKFGEAGSGDGQILYGPGLDVYAATGDVYVSDAFNQRIDRFDADGNFELAFGWGVVDGSDEFQICASGCLAGLPGSGAGQFPGPFQGPRAIAVDQTDGSVYVLDAGNARIQKFGPGGEFLFAFGWGVADGNPELQVCTTLCQSGLPGSGAGQLNEGWGAAIAVDPTSGHLLVPDPASQRVQEFSSSGGFVRMFGGDVEQGGGEGFEICSEAAECKPGVAGEDPGEFNAGQPEKVAVASDGTIYVVESSPVRIVKLTPSSGSLIPSEVPFSVETSGLSGFGFDRSTGHLVLGVIDPVSSKIYAVELDGSGAEVDHYLGGVNSAAFPAIAFNEVTGRGYAASNEGPVYILGDILPPAVEIQPATDVTATGAVLNGTVNSQGAPGADYHFEYRIEGGDWIPLGGGTAPGDSSDHQVSAQLSPAVGLEPNRTYYARLVAQKPNNEAVFSSEQPFTTLGEAPRAETVGSPFRTATSARLDARVNPRGSETTYHFEWGLDASYGNVAPAGDQGDAGAGLRSVLASTSLTDLEPSTTYHYRVVAENASGTTLGEDRTVTTRPSDAPLTHGHLPGPPGSDRAYEQVNLPDTGGNPVPMGYAFSDDGNRAIYQVNGGTPLSESGTLQNQLFAERTAGGWVTSSIWPARAEATGSAWRQPAATADLSKVTGENAYPGVSQWLMGPGLKPKMLAEVPAENEGRWYGASEDLSRFVARMQGSLDPENPVSDPQNAQLYDITSGTPRLFSFMPDGSIPSCGVSIDSSPSNLPNNFPRRDVHWISADGSRAFFPSPGDRPGCGGAGTSLYMRDFNAAATVKLSGPPISGPECTPAFIKSTETAAYFWTQSRLDPADTEPAPGNCSEMFVTDAGDGDVYRYTLAMGELTCLTCGFGVDADVRSVTSNYGGGIGVSDDDSRLYFNSPRRLVSGEGEEGASNIYRLAIAGGELKFVSPAGMPGDLAIDREAINPDGSVIVFAAASPAMNPLTGSDNGGEMQYYRYDDRDGSLVCASCPTDGSPAGKTGVMVAEQQIGPNTTALSDAGDFVFISAAPLLPADQNTSREGEMPELGYDVYEWRDGHLLLITTGQTRWDSPQNGAPSISGITPSGRDVFFSVAEPLTPDAIDGYARLYDARIGGGFEFPPPPSPCPLEICQGEARGAPVDPVPSSTGFRGAGNVKPAVRKAKRKCVRRHGKKRCAKKKHMKKHTKKNGRAN